MKMIHVENNPLQARNAEEEGETRVSDVCGYNHPRSTHIYDDGDVVVFTDQQQRSLMLARGHLATCYINVPMVVQNLSSSYSSYCILRTCY